jgi:PPK2 family polyphosphate:nucleotide phosphotransferase
MDTSRFRIRPGEMVRLRRRATDDTRPFRNKRKAVDKLKRGLERLVKLQEVLYAENRWSLLLVFQGMDAAGKDSAIKHVMSGLNPQGTQVYSFKRPSDEELDHDYLWRSVKALPERGRIGIFNRSYYEEVLVVKVHPEILAGEELPPSLVTPRIWAQRYEDINAFERYLSRNGTVIRKFFLHMSREEQRRRLLERLDEPSKNWKFQPGDLDERDRWDEYQRAYEQMLSKTSTRHAPWFVVPADHKWYTRLVVAAAIVDALAAMDLKRPPLTAEQQSAIKLAKKTLEGRLDK